ncbi:AMP-binding protein [Sneathia vaginalis]|uniref:AMP-binding protein n=1 Tax=Sneathia vaginalis TaxID=187101 RepID=UPI00370DA754
MKEIYKFFEENMMKFSNKICIIDDNKEITYGDMLNLVNKICDRLNLLEIKEKHKILIISNNNIEVVAIMLACIKMKIVFSFIQSNNKRKYDIIQNLNPNIVILEEKNEEIKNSIEIKELLDFNNEIKIFKINDLIIDNDLEDIFSILYTSASTSVNPKGVIISYGNISASLNAILESVPYSFNDIILNYLPLSFDYGLYQVLFNFKLGSTLILKNYPLFPSNIVEDLKKYKITIFPGMKSLFYFIKLINNIEFKFLKLITNTGESITEQEIKKIMLLFPNANIYLMYGLTECKRVSIFNLNDNMSKIKSVGKVLNNMESYVINEKGNIADKFEIGELYIKGTNVCKGYYNNIEDTNKTFIGNNILKTGDLVYFDDDDFLYFVGRKDKVFKKNGYLIMSSYIENKFMDEIYKKYKVNIYAIILNYKNRFILSIYNNNNNNLDTNNIIKIYKDIFNKWEYPDKIIFFNKKIPFSINGKINRKKINEDIIYELEREFK